MRVTFDRGVHVKRITYLARKQQVCIRNNKLFKNILQVPFKAFTMKSFTQVCSFTDIIVLFRLKIVSYIVEMFTIFVHPYISHTHQVLANRVDAGARTDWKRVRELWPEHVTNT